MNVLVVGAGMYVSGRGTSAPGTVLASLAQASRELPIESVTVVARNPENAGHISRTLENLNTRLGTRLTCTYRPIDGDRMRSELPSIMRDTPFDCAIVSTPDDTHYAIVGALIEMKVPVLVVKPFVDSLEDGIALVRKARDTNCYGAVEFHKRFDESNRYAKRVIGDGTLGDLLYITVDYSQRVTIPTTLFRSWAHRTNVFQYLAVHYVDLVYYMTGYRPVRLTATASETLLKGLGIDTPDSIHVTIQWESADNASRLISVINTNWIDPDSTSAMSDQRMTIVGTKGRLDCDQKHRGIEQVTSDGGSQHVNPYFAEFLATDLGIQEFSGYGYRSIRRFIEDVGNLAAGTTTIEELDRSRPSFRQALVSTAVTDTVGRALDGPPRWLEIPPVG